MLFHRNAAMFDVLDELAGLASASVLQLEGAARSGPDQSDEEDLRVAGQRARQLMHAMNERLAHAFRPPIDAEDVHHLAQDLGSIVHAVDDMVRRLRLFHAVPVSRELARELQILSQTAQAIDRAVHLLRNRRQMRDLSPVVAQIRELKEVGDEYRDAAIARLYDGSVSVPLVLQQTELHGLVETALRMCKDIANVLERIAVKGA